LKKTIKFGLSICLGVGLVWFLVDYLRDKDVIDQLSKLEPKSFLISSLFLYTGFIINGLQLNVALKKTQNINLTIGDTLSLPMVQNLWGYIIPFQGSFIYSAAFLKMKYKAMIESTLSVYIFTILSSLFLGALFGFFFTLNFNWELSLIFLLVMTFPIIIIIVNRVLNYVKPKFLFLQKAKAVISSIIGSLIFMIKDKKLTLKVVILDVLYVLTYASWSYYLSEIFQFAIPFPIFILLAFVIKVSLIAKITPGNMGVNQLFSGGFLALYGFSQDIGIFISILQLALLALMSFPIAIVISIYNLKFLKRS